MLKILFKPKKELTLMKEKDRLEVEIQRLKDEIRKKDGFLRCKNNIFIEKDNRRKQEENWQEMEEELKKYYKENNELRKYTSYSDQILSSSYLKFNYLIPIEKYLCEVRFRELVKILKKKGNNFVQDLNEFTIGSLSIEDNLKLELKKKFERFQSLQINWEMKTYLLKGEKISKIYFKNRRFINIMLSENKEFMSDLIGYNFDNLVNKEYSLDESEELKNIYQDYILRYRFEAP
ncbi:hypothetical protein [Cetobacterium somerae]|uniref:hypothetical protein n=1 Tax=Cetobacterium somerae TaxID=188913 RepID=UPI0038912E6C